MMLMNKKRGAILATSVYADGKLGADDAEITPPDVEFLTATIQAAGELTVPLAGLVGDMEFGITVSGASADLNILAQPEQHTVVCNAVQQVIGIDGSAKEEQIKYTVTGFGKKVPSATAKQGEASSQSYIISCISYKMAVDGEEITNINKLSGDCVVNGKNYGSNIRSLL